MGARRRSSRSVALALLVFAVAGAYLLFRQIYFAGARLPFAQEMVLVFLGAVATIFLTAVLLNRQTELELAKEGRVLLFDKKNTVYMATIEKIAEIVEKRDHDPELIDDLRVLGHKLAVLGSAPVVEAFKGVLDLLIGGLQDGSLNDADAQTVMQAVAEVTFAMRRDILADIGEESSETTHQLIFMNARRMERLDDLSDLAGRKRRKDG